MIMTAKLCHVYNIIRTHLRQQNAHSLDDFAVICTQIECSSLLDTLPLLCLSLSWPLHL